MWLNIKIDARHYSLYLNILRVRKTFCLVFRSILNVYNFYTVLILSNLFSLSSSEPTLFLNLFSITVDVQY